jgi:hypothetical protein
MREPVCVVAADAKLETPEGALTMRTLCAIPAPVLSRTPDGTVRFAMIAQVRKLDAPQPLVRITVAGGQSFRVGRPQVLFKKGSVEVRADAVQRGDELEPVYAYPAGYLYRTDDGREETSRASVAVTAVADEGEGDVYTFAVPRTGCFLFSAGVLGKAET